MASPAAPGARSHRRRADRCWSVAGEDPFPLRGQVRDAQREILLSARLLAVKGRWQRNGAVCNLIADRLADLSHLMGRLATESRNFK
ncbi:hypothetical protein JQN63_14490 [Delftia lacustris]|uniref:hypothetical protein n=1 Tax=Delftia lacustris TaxID=558537 RepID=UPI00193BD2D4|nr:hypothetical protein [Delftia lacustris]QRI93007.1 hypothetical protein JQN63_14490 [Delftia lacustris]